MAHVPRRPVTFLFSDIEGSTLLLRRLGDSYVDVLADHRRVLRAAFGAHGGREVGAEGDAFFVAFERPGDAIAAALEGQRGLRAMCRSAGVDVRVRMGLHTGEAVVHGDGYVGLAVHRAARICSAGHGGQIVVSSATRELVADSLAPGVSLRDLGVYLLKDLAVPDHLFQAVAADLPAEFPPLRAVAAERFTAPALPRLRGRTIGREDDCRAVAERLRVGGVRLVTLTGPGGVGKTRLALEAAWAAQSDFVDGARFVSLAAVERADDVSSAVAQSVGIVALPGERPEQSLRRFLAANHMLLVLDNFEHVLTAAPLVADLLATCPALTVLATSREPLRIAGEGRFPVAPLTLPTGQAPVEALARVPAVALFVERVREQDPGFEVGEANAGAVVEICHRLDGLPLAIELAAARCSLLSPAEIAERLDAALAVLGHGPRDAPVRQQTLQATIDWSHTLLSGAERDCFARFAVFAGGATIDAAQAVTHADLDTLDSLVAKSLLVRRQRTRGSTRLVMLETIRAHADERLTASGSRLDVQEEHYGHFLGLAQAHGTERALAGTDQGEHLAVLDAEIDNLHGALRWAVGENDGGRALAMVAALSWYWLARSHHDAIDWCEEALRLPAGDDVDALRFRALCVEAGFLWRLGRPSSVPAVLDRAEAIARRLDNAAYRSQILQIRAETAGAAGRMELCEVYADEAMHWAARAGDEWEVANASFGKVVTAATVPELRRRVGWATALGRRVGNLKRVMMVLNAAAYVALCMGDEHEAKDFADAALTAVRAIDDPFGWMLIHGNLGLAALLTGDIVAAEEALREELRLCRQLVAPQIAAEGLIGLAAIAAVRGDHRRAGELVGAAQMLQHGLPQDEIAAVLDVRFLEHARTVEGTSAWDAAVSYGATLSFEDAIAYALGEPAGTA